jgi:DNA-binding MurR/RpiR family transcriptional regulator
MMELETGELRPFEQEFASRAADARGQLSGNDERILPYLQKSLDDLPFHTADSLAQSIGVSRAAVVRFARRIGYAGFTELQLASRQALRTARESPLARFETARSGSLLEQKAIQDSRNVLATQALVKGVVEPAAKSIAQASRVFVLGARMSYALAVHFHRLLTDVHDGAHLVDPAFPDVVAGAGPNDVLVACLFRRYSRLTVQLITTARDSGAHIVLVTDGRGHDFAANADHVLVAVASGPALYDSMVAPLWLLESLVAEVAAVDPARSRARLQTIERFAEDYRLLMG